MKNYLFIVLVISCLSAKAQIRRFEFSAGMGNNGQIQKVLDDYFYPADSWYLMDGSETTDISAFKYNLTGKLYFNERYSLRLRYGHYKLNNSYYYSTNELYGNFEASHVVTNLNPAFCVSEKIGKFNFSTGLELAFYKVNKFYFHFEGHDIFAILNTTYPRYIDSRFEMDGGKITGINNFIEMEYTATSRFGIGVSVSYGMMFARFGDQTKEENRFVLPPSSGISIQNYKVETPKSYKKNYFSAPELSAFLFFRFGNTMPPPKIK